MKKVVRIVILSVFAFCLSIACKNYTEDIEDYLSYWSAGVSIAEYRFEPQPQIYTEGMQYVSSKAPVTVTFTVHNSKNLNLKMPGDSDAPADIISFPHIPDAPDKRVAAPQSGNDYEFKKISNTELKLTYNPAFLQKYEWGRGDITPSIILYTTDGRMFKQNIPFKLNVNTPPPAIAECVVGQTETASPFETCYYVLCLQLSDDDMKKTCGNGLLHGDIAGIEIAGIPYSLSVDGTQKQLNVQGQGDSPFIGKDKVTKLATTDAKEIPSDWTLYFKTKVKVKLDSPKTEYTVKLKDAKGLYSEPVTVGTQGKIVTVTFKLAGGNIGGNTDAITMTGVPGASFTAPVPTRQGYTFNDWNPSLPTHPVFPAADTTYTAQWTLNTYTVKFEVDGGHGSLTGTHDGTTHTANGSTQLQFESVPHNSTITFTATPSGGWEVGKWMLDSSEVSGYTNTSYTLSNVTGNKTVKVKFKKKQGIIDGNTETHAWKELRERVAAADDDAVITVKNAITASAASGNNGEIVINKNITIQGTGRTSEKLDAASLSRIFRVKDGKALTLKNITLTGGNTKNEQGDKNGGGVYIEDGSCTMNNVLVVGCTADSGGAVYIKNGTFSISGSTRITPSDGADEQTAGKNDVYLKSGKFITVTSALTGTTPIARITPENYPAGSTAVKVLDGAAVTTEYTKFKVTDQAGSPSKKWKINASGELEAVGGQSPAIEATSWEDLRTKVQSASDGTVIEVTQDITYGFTSVNSIIEVKKNITIKSKGSNTYILNAGGKGADNTASNTKSIGIFEVSGGKTLTLENLILTKTERYAVYVAEGDNSLTMRYVTITDCKTKWNVAGIYFYKGKNLTLENCTIEKCNGNGGLSSGGIEIQAPTGPVSIKNTTIKNCKANSTGGGIQLYNGQCTLENVTVDNCSAKKGGGMCVKKSTLTITGGSFTKNAADGKTSEGGGGAIYNEDSTVTITGCTIGGDTEDDGNSAGQGGGIFVSEDARCTLNAGTKISSNKAIRIGTNNSNGGGIFVNKVQSGTQAGTLTINGSSENPVVIAKNMADYGGGVYNHGTATINYAEIKGNNVPHHGGGMFNAGTCTMDGVTLQNNKAKSEGGGIYSNKELTLKNTTVTGNEATASGGAIQIATADSVFNMLGSTVVKVDSSKNDIYLTDGALITLTGELTAMGKIARITLNSSTKNGYKAGRVVVKGGDGFNITTNYKKKFTITNKIGQSKAWKLSLSSNELKLEQ